MRLTTTPDIIIEGEDGTSLYTPDVRYALLAEKVIGIANATFDIPAGSNHPEYTIPREITGTRLLGTVEGDREGRPSNHRQRDQSGT